MVSTDAGRSLGDDLGAPARLASKAQDENFPVASHLLPREARASLMAVYGFARFVDDLGDEADGDRLTLLDFAEAELDRAAAGQATQPVFQSLTPVIQGLDLDLEPFRNLIDANRMDQRVTRYESFGDLVEYCMLSAAPVGRLVLAVFRASTPGRVALSDNVCIALQIVEHLQDVGEDARRGRIYLPADDMENFGCSEGELLRAQASPALKRLVAMEVRRARCLLSSGVSLASSLKFRPRVAVVGFTAGGMAALDSINRAGNDVLKNRCRPRKVGFASRALSELVAASVKRNRL
ncbi:MAG: squalene synthase HpnC [Acidimicrobiales bacterium]|jgi:squalene synthase HpnC